jgi:hypothetical protein
MDKVPEIVEITGLRHALREAVEQIERHGLPGFNRNNIDQFDRWKTLANGGDQP